jgi:hypothetical protein
MDIQTYSEDIHYVPIIRALHARDTYIPMISEMPAIGFLAYDGDTLVSYCALRMVEGNSAIVDGLTSNPECTSDQRHEGNDLVINACIDKAKSLNLRNLIAFTVDKATKERSIKNGFEELHHTCLTYNLRRKGY